MTEPTAVPLVDRRWRRCLTSLLAVYGISHAATYLPLLLAHYELVPSLPINIHLAFLAPDYLRLLTLHALILLVVLVDRRLWVGCLCTGLCFMLSIRPEILLTYRLAFPSFVFEYGFDPLIAYALSLLLSPLLGRLITRDSNENLLTIRKLLMVAAVISIVCAILAVNSEQPLAKWKVPLAAVAWLVTATAFGVIFATRFCLALFAFIVASLLYVTLQNIQFGAGPITQCGLPWSATVSMALLLSLLARRIHVGCGVGYE